MAGFRQAGIRRVRIPESICEAGGDVPLIQIQDAFYHFHDLFIGSPDAVGSSPGFSQLKVIFLNELSVQP